MLAWYRSASIAMQVSSSATTLARLFAALSVSAALLTSHADRAWGEDFAEPTPAHEESVLVATHEMPEDEALEEEAGETDDSITVTQALEATPESAAADAKKQSRHKL